MKKPKRPRGAQVGNTNSVKNAWSVLWRRKSVPPNYRWLIPAMSKYRSGLQSDKGDMSNGEQRVVELAALSRGCIHLILDECFKHGLVREREGQWGLSDAMKDLPRFIGKELDCLKTLGLERRCEEIPSLSAYLEGPAHKTEPAVEPEENGGQ